MSDYSDTARKTGRTTRAVTRCLIAAASGKRVAYVVHSSAMVEYVRQIAERLCGDVGVPDTFSVHSRQSFRSSGIDIDRIEFDHVQGQG